uniref:Uncharacterized protein n=1 Tax=Setaria viridis TaxID=4556 RepID=A0A4U6WFN2_SETVI|nr:hypothetical protein SEVIR_1G320500v2 [Setaria viridis]
MTDNSVPISTEAPGHSHPKSSHHCFLTGTYLDFSFTCFAQNEVI